MINMRIAQHTYQPVIREDWSKLILEDLFETESCVKYAKKHVFDVLLTETTNTSTAEAIAVFLQAGFALELVEEECIAPPPHYTPLPPEIHFLFKHPQNIKSVT